MAASKSSSSKNTPKQQENSPQNQYSPKNQQNQSKKDNNKGLDNNDISTKARRDESPSGQPTQRRSSTRKQASLVGESLTKNQQKSKKETKSEEKNNKNQPNQQNQDKKGQMSSTTVLSQRVNSSFRRSNNDSKKNYNDTDTENDEEEGIDEKTGLLDKNGPNSLNFTQNGPNSSNFTQNGPNVPNSVQNGSKSPQSDQPPLDGDIDERTTYKTIQVVDAEAELGDLLGVGKEKQSIWLDLRGDVINVLILTMLYILQGLPIGLSQTIPLVMAEKKVGFAAQAVFSLVTMPFSLKLLWAPFVDTFYFPSFGKRKSWILPTQVLCGISLLYFSSTINYWISGPGGGDLVGVTSGDVQTPQVNVFALSTFFIFLYFLMATQDIAVDAWALTMLRSRNVVWAGTINNIGQYMGMYLTNISYLLLSSPSFCSKYLWFLLPKTLNPLTNQMEIVPQGLIDITILMKICGLMFIVTTMIILAFKKETDVHVYDYVADLFWQLQERKRQCNMLNTPLTITVEGNEAVRNGNKKGKKSKGSKHSTVQISTSSSSSSLSSSPTSSNNTLVNYNKDVSEQIPKRLYPHPMQDETSISEMNLLSEKLHRLTTGNTDNIITLTNKNGTKNDEKIDTQNIISIISSERRYLAAAEDDDDSEGLLDTLSRMKSILTLPNVRLLVFWLLTFRISVAACDSLTELKLFSRGLPKEQLAYMTSLSAPLTFLVPIYLTSLVSSYKRPFAISVGSLLPRIALCFLWVTFVAIFPTLLYHEQSWTIFIVLFLLTMMQHFIGLTQMVCGMSFFALVSDPKIAGTFITMLHTAANFGSLFIRITTMFLVDLFTVKICTAKTFNPMPKKVNSDDQNDQNDQNDEAQNQENTIRNEKNYNNDNNNKNGSYTQDDVLMMLTHTNATTAPDVDIDQQYHDYLLHNLKILTSEKTGETIIVDEKDEKSKDQQKSNEKSEKSEKTNTPISPFIRTLLKQPIEDQRHIVHDIYTNDLTTGNVMLYDLTYYFLNSVRKFGERIGILTEQTSRLFFNQIYLIPHQDQKEVQKEQIEQQKKGGNDNESSLLKSLLSSTSRQFSTCDPVIQPNYKELLKNNELIQQWPNYSSEILPELSSTNLSSSSSSFLSLSSSSSQTSSSQSDFITQALTMTHDHHKVENMCEAIGGQCVPIIDGYFVEVIVCGLFGFVYFALVWPRLKHLDQAPLSSWRSTRA